MPEATKDDWKARARMQQSFLAMLDGTKDEIAARGRKYNPMWHPDEFDTWAESKTQFRPPESWTKRFTQQRPPWQDPVKKFECPVLLVRGGNPLRGRIVSPETAAEAQEISRAGGRHARRSRPQRAPRSVRRLRRHGARLPAQELVAGCF